MPDFKYIFNNLAEKVINGAVDFYFYFIFWAESLGSFYGIPVVALLSVILLLALVFIAYGVVLLVKRKRGRKAAGGAAVLPEVKKKAVEPADGRGRAPVSDVKNASLLSLRLSGGFNDVERRNILIENMKLLFENAAAAFKKTSGAFYELPDGGALANWGIKNSTGNVEHDALNAVRGALILRLKILKLNKERPKEAAVRFICAINTGKFIVESGERHFLGDSLALRAREACEKYGVDIVVSAKTLRLVEQYLIVEELPPLEDSSYKNKNAPPIRLFAVINLRSKADERQPSPVNLKELKEILG